MKHEEIIKRLDQEIAVLRVESERFFNGDLRVPPEQARTDLLTNIRTLRNSSLPTFAERFRISTLEAKFNSFNELYLRRMRKLEYGDMIQKGPAASRVKAARPKTRQKARQSVQIAKTLDTQSPSMDTLRALYGEIQNAIPSKPLPEFQKFSQTLSNQLQQLRTKTGCREVQIKCTPNGGKLKLVVKPVKTGPKTVATTTA